MRSQLGFVQHYSLELNWWNLCVFSPILMMDIFIFSDSFLTIESLDFLVIICTQSYFISLFVWITIKSLLWHWDDFLSLKKNFMFLFWLINIFFFFLLKKLPVFNLVSFKTFFSSHVFWFPLLFLLLCHCPFSMNIYISRHKVTKSLLTPFNSSFIIPRWAFFQALFYNW